MNSIDIIIVIIIGFCFFLGFKRGFTKQVVCCLGFLITVILAYFLKNPLSIILYEHLPFFKLTGIFKCVGILNILIYEIIAFLTILTILNILWRLVIIFSSLFEKFLNATIILSIPSKLLGGLLGIFEGLVLVFIGLYVLSLPMIDYKPLNDSKIKELVLTKVPTNFDFKIKEINIINDFNKIKKDNTCLELNDETIKMFLKYNIVSIDSLKYLNEQGKINIDIKKYEEEF